MSKIRFTEISKHPGKDCYMLHVINLGIPPFFGSLAECKEIEKKVSEMWDNSTIENKKKWLSQIRTEYLVRFKANSDESELKILGLI